MNPDVLVIGAGAAGIAAARALHDAGVDTLLIEARDRVGGRARTIHHGDAALDLGCGWLHSARRNSWTDVARAAGFTIATDTANWSEQWRDLGYSADEQAAFGRAWDAWEARARAAADGPDQPLSAFVAPDDRWRPMLDAISGYVNGANLSDVSLHDWLAYEDAATDDNWAVREGYGTLVAHHAAGLTVRTNVVARHIDHTGNLLRVTTDAGTITARAVIVAVPNSILADERLSFTPALPDKHAAAAALPLGVADKAFLAVTGAHWPHDAHLIGNPHTACTASHRLSPFGWPVVESFFGGDCADMLEGGDAAAFAIDELVALLGSDWRARLRPITTTRWRHEAWIEGSYSHARVGHAGERAVLARPVEDRLFFAGEACSPHDFSTAHGARDTGLAAAAAILRAVPSWS
ncbi:FAD-dependent oxidoreductase [Sphingomonas sp. RHCKR47]|uniref:flavin monoamine oxidase family protein n=1 Tax=Sphingomonas citricola TaxID=2862498 RepID=UPI001C67F199|nr:NAD(P)/FAD-dependent oxidoreductase [Sphingomonas citricola]MBW6522315.1 FAD-dependent oxidoreductase [Sphingomonas citricola]